MVRSPSGDDIVETDQRGHEIKSRKGDGNPPLREKTAHPRVVGRRKRETAFPSNRTIRSDAPQRNAIGQVWASSIR